MSDARKGFRYSAETKRKMSEARKGEKNPAWNGGSSKFPYAPDWGPKVKGKVLKRDCYECQNPKCDCASETLHIHHINYDKMNCDSTNLMTLCISSHGMTQNNRLYWQDFYEKIIGNREYWKEVL